MSINATHTKEHDEMVCKLLDFEKAKTILDCKYILAAISEVQIPLLDRGFGFIDVASAIVTYDPEEIVVLCVECKPKITSFGETLRQLNRYRSALKHNSVLHTALVESKQSKVFERARATGYAIPLWYVLFTKDNTYTKQFEQNGIVVVIDE